MRAIWKKTLTLLLALCLMAGLLPLGALAARLGDDAGNLAEFSRLIRQLNGNGENPVAENETLLYHRAHRNHIHVAA